MQLSVGSIKKNLHSFYKKGSFSIQSYFSYIGKTINSGIVKEINLSNFNVLLHIKGSKNHISYNLSEIIFDLAIMSSLTPEDASSIGFCYGLNYKLMIARNESSYHFLFNKSQANRYNLISIDRKKTLSFSSSFQDITNIVHMSAEEIFNSKILLNGFHPIQACYIGILAGINTKSKNDLA